MTSRAWSVIAILALTIVVGALAWVRCEGTPPEIAAPDEIRVGRAGRTVEVSASDDDSGVRTLSVRLRHAGGERVLLDQKLLGDPLRGGLEPETPSFEVDLDAEALGLGEGTAFLDVSATDWSWSGFLRGNEARVEVPVTVDLTPPGLSVESGLTYVQRGGAGAVVYGLPDAGTDPRHGVEVDEAFFRGYPLEREGGRFVAVFAVPRDAADPPRIRVVAEDRAGNRAERTWPVRVQERRFDDVEIRLSRPFLDNKVAALADELGVDAGSPLADFQEINTQVRAENEARIREIVGESEPEPLFQGPFVQLRNSAVTSRFAEHRTYLLDGEPVSEAIHYGYDLASTAGAPIEASNAGRVLHAGPLGIYGGCVILDHGLGVASLYAHLSRIDVEEGAPVARGQTLGLSGQTGLAGGDHLHFAILVGRAYVDPVEWWDPKWMRERLEPKLPAR